MTKHKTTIMIDGIAVETLADILPSNPGLKVLFVGKTPVPLSVAKGHYHQGGFGQSFWKQLQDYDILTATSEFEDDSLLHHGFGMTDVVKKPHAFRKEPSAAEYKFGTPRVLEFIETHKPEITVFVYKKALDKVMKHAFNLKERAVYGFNPQLQASFGCDIFVMPIPGVGSVRGSVIRDSLVALANRIARI